MKFRSFIVIVGLYFLLAAPELVILTLDLNKKEGVGTRVISVKHEDVLQDQRRYFLSLGVPEDAGVERLALLGSYQDQSQQKDEL